MFYFQFKLASFGTENNLSTAQWWCNLSGSDRPRSCPADFPAYAAVTLGGRLSDMWGMLRLVPRTHREWQPEVAPTMLWDLFLWLLGGVPGAGRWWLVVARYRDVLSESCQWTGPPTRILSLGSRPGRAEWACLADSTLLSRTQAGLLKWKLGTLPYTGQPGRDSGNTP